jgi:hypothetical protein
MANRTESGRCGQRTIHNCLQLGTKFANAFAVLCSRYAPAASGLRRPQE